MSGKRQHMLNENIFEILTPESAYWIGFIAADGSISHPNNKNKRSYTTGICLGIRDIDHLKKFQNFIESSHKMYKDKRCCHLNISSRKMYNDLLYHGIKPLKTYSLESHISNIPDEYKKYFIAGLFDGDGTCVTRNKKVFDKKYNRDYFYNLCTIRLLSNIKTLEDIMDYMYQYWDIDYAKISKTKSKYVYTISLYSDKNIRNFYELYKETPVCLERKLYKIEEFLSKKDKFVDKRFG